MTKFKIGDCVKIINTEDCTTKIMESELGTVGTVTNVDYEEDMTVIYEVDDKWWWLENNLQKGHMVWVADNEN